MIPTLALCSRISFPHEPTLPLLGLRRAFPWANISHYMLCASPAQEQCVLKKLPPPACCTLLPMSSSCQWGRQSQQDMGESSRWGSTRPPSHPADWRRVPTTSLRTPRSVITCPWAHLKNLVMLNNQNIQGPHIQSALRDKQISYGSSEKAPLSRCLPFSIQTPTKQAHVRWTNASTPKITAQRKIQLLICFPVCNDLAHDKKRCVCLEKSRTLTVHVLAQYPGLNYHPI